MIKAIIFDLGGVLVRLDKERCLRAFRERVGFGRIAEFLDTSHQRGPFGDLEAGRISETQFFEECLRYCSPGTTAAQIRRCFGDLQGPFAPEVLTLLSELKERYALYILSNNSSVTMARTYESAAQAHLDLQATFRRIYVSQELKLLKPDPAIFDYLIRDIGLLPEEMLFVDDSPRNVEAARAAGMNALHHDPGRNLAETLSCVPNVL
ncbi:MAG: HAD family phosphatase [Bacteroidales bacterium]|nr:HAD family phosphatase [Bacteroidales bacterium]